MIPRRAGLPSSTMRSSWLARAKAFTASIFASNSRFSASIGGSGQRMLSPPGGISKSLGMTTLIRDGSETIEAEVEIFLQGRGVDHRDQSGGEHLLALMGQRRGLAAVIVTGEREHAAMA